MNSRISLKEAKREIERLKSENGSLKVKLKKESSLRRKNKQLQEQLNL